jgi:amino acid transporter
METKKLNLFMSILKIGLVAIGVILSLFIIGGPNMESTVEAQETFREGASMSLATSFTGFIIFASVGLILLFFVVQLITNPKKTVMSIIGLLVALVLYLIFLMIGTSDTNESLALLEDVQVAQGTIASSSAGLYTVISGVVIALLVAVFGPLFGRYRK